MEDTNSHHGCITRKLVNGVVAIIESEMRFKSTAIGFWFNFGSSDEADDERGFTHFIEHMVFKGSKRRNAEEIARSIDRVGGYLNAFTERDTTCFHCTVPSSYEDLAIDVLSDMIFYAAFEETEFRKEKDVIINETLAALDEPEEAGGDEFAARLWPNDPHGRRITGTTADVEAVDLERLVAFWRKRFQAADCIVSVSGAVDGACICDSIERHLERNHGEPFMRVDASPLYRRYIGFKNAPLKQTYLYAGIMLESPFSVNEYWVASVASGAFGEAMSSRLFQELRERRGLCYTVGSSFSLSPGFGFWAAFAVSTPDRFRELLEEYCHQLSLFAESGLSGMETAESASRIAGSMLLGSDDVEYRMRRLARQYLYNGKTETMEASLENVRTVSVQDVQDFAASRLNECNQSLFAYGKITREIRIAIARFENRE